jgi:hypothetical protein
VVVIATQKGGSYFNKNQQITGDDLGEDGAIRVVCKLKPTVFWPLAIEGLHFNNYSLLSLIMRIFKKLLK